MIKKTYSLLQAFGNALQSPLLLLCRLYWGWLFVHSGWDKLTDPLQFAQFLQGMHFPFPEFFAFCAGGSEFLGGICLFLGFFSRLAAIPLIIVMVVAYSTAHVEALRLFFHHPSVFVAQAPFNFLLTCLLVFAFGPGSYSIDYLLRIEQSNRVDKL